MIKIQDNLIKNRIPEHVAIIMDGNGRWAESQGKQRFEGHQEGVVSVKSVVEAASEIGVKHLTLYAFSTENWNRPKEEIEALMSLLVSTLKSEVFDLSKNNIRLNAIGDLNSLPETVQEELQEAIEETSNNTGLTIHIALSYSSRWEIKNAVSCILKDFKNKDVEITDELISDYLTTKNTPDPDLLIRTSGEYRISNFLLWQIAYSELYFTNTYWPDFRKEAFFEAINDYQKRERRFGKTSAQL